MAPRTITPKRWALAAMGGLAVAGLPQGPLSPPAAHAATDTAAPETATPAASEAGEAGEAGIVAPDGVVSDLGDLGLYEAAFLTVAALYDQGHVAAAREQLETSHHAFYDDIEPILARIGAEGFADKAQVFARVVERDEGRAAAQAALMPLVDAIEAARVKTGATPRERVMAMHALLTLAADEYEGGVAADGTVVNGHEYRDAWGFVAVAQQQAHRLRKLAGNELGLDLARRIEDTRPAFAGLTAEKIPHPDPGALAAAAGWVEIIGLRLD